MMKTTFYALLMVCVFGFSACEKDEGQLASSSVEGYLQLEVIVNPMIHPYAQEVSFTVDDVRVSDQPIERFVPDAPLVFNAESTPLRTQLGSTAVLAPGGYANVQLDLNTSANGGSYLSNPDGGMDRLGLGANTTHTIRSEASFLVESGLTTERVILLDLNKMISSGNEDQLNFSFRENSSVGSDVLLFDPKTVGRISGKVNRTIDAPRQTHRLVVYAYPFGSFIREVELKNDFSSAIISSNVHRNDKFNFPVLKEGAYELVVAHYEDIDQNGVLEFKELLQADADVRANTRVTRVSANSETTVDVTLGGVIAN